MTEAMLFLQKTILLSYDPRPFARCFFSLYFMHVQTCTKQSKLLCLFQIAYRVSYWVTYRVIYRVI